MGDAKCLLSFIVFFFLTPFGVGLDRSLAQAGMDPSSILLLSPSGGASHNSIANDVKQNSPRYITKPNRNTTERASPGPKKQTNLKESTLSVNPPVVIPTVAESVDRKEKSASDKERPHQTASTPALAGQDGAEGEPIEKPDREAESRLIQQRRLIEIGVSSGFLYEDSASSYSFRRYSFAAPVYQVDGNVWLSPEFGLRGVYFSTLGGTVPDSVGDITIQRSELAAGILLRNKALTKADGEISLGIDFIERDLAVPSEAAQRLKLKTSGVRLSLDADWEYWGFGFSVSPSLSHQESSNAGITSGTSSEAYQVGLQVWRRWRITTRHSMFLRLRHDVEQDIFSGAASTPDIETGLTPKGVGVRSSTTVIQFGVDWGQ